MMKSLAMRHRKILRISLLLAVVIASLAAYFPWRCPRIGFPLSAEMRASYLLKNRAELPQESDFDDRVTLAALLQPGDDRNRWSEARAAAIEGYVVGVLEGGIEGCNCLSIVRRDTHINMALAPVSKPREFVVVEVTPLLRERAAGCGQDWSTAVLRRELVGHWCRIEGWLYFDSHHAEEAENTASGGEKNWRGTAWEIHPITQIKVLR